MSADPAGRLDGLNLFRFVRNNPCSNIDSQGLVGVLLNGYEVMATGIANFTKTERDQYNDAVNVAINLLDIGLGMPNLPESDMRVFFGSKHLSQIDKIKDTWKKTRSLIAEFNTTARADQKLFKVKQKTDNIKATAGVTNGFILLHEFFFNKTLSTEVRAATLIHEFSHLSPAQGGAGTTDIFYLDEKTPKADADKKVNKGKLKEKDLIEPAELLREVASFLNLTPTAAEGNNIQYFDKKNKPLTLEKALKEYNKNALLQAHVSSRTADPISHSLRTIAKSFAGI